MHSGQVLTTFCGLHADADEEYIYMNKVIVTGKDKDDKGVSYKWFFFLKMWYWYEVMVLFFSLKSSWNIIYKENNLNLLIENTVLWRNIAFQPQ